MSDAIKTIIVEDQDLALEYLSQMVQDNCPHLEVVAACTSGEEAVSAIQKHQPQLVFMDHDLGTMKGFDVLDRTQHLNFRTIFTTQFNDEAIKALNSYNATFYILKPIEPNQLVEAVGKASKEIFEQEKSKEILEGLAKTTSEIKAILGENKYLMVPSKGEKRFIPQKKILFLRGANTQTLLTLVSGSTVVYSKNLGEVTKLLPPNKFCRVHKSFTVNMEYVELVKYDEQKESYSIMLPHPQNKEGYQIPIGKYYNEDFSNFFNS